MPSYHGRQIRCAGLRMFSRSCSGRIVLVRSEARITEAVCIGSAHQQKHVKGVVCPGALSIERLEGSRPGLRRTLWNLNVVQGWC